MAATDDNEWGWPPKRAPELTAQRVSEKRTGAAPFVFKGARFLFPLLFLRRERRRLERVACSGRPGEVIFAELNFEPAFGGKQIHGQAAFPQRDHQGK